MALEPPGVARAAAYLEGVSFPDRWQERRQLPSSQSDEEMRELLARCHEDLRDLYGKAAERDLAVVKQFSF